MKHSMSSPSPLAPLRTIVTCLLVAHFTACATNNPPPPANVEDMSGEDMDMSISSPDMSSDLGLPEVEDMQEEMPVDLGPPMICTPTTRECVGETGFRVCDDGGMMWVEDTCMEGDICEAGTCVPGPICVPGEATCVDAMNRQVCRPGGMAFGVEACDAESSCIQGECVSGELNGALCASHDECAGGRCHCGEMTAEQCSDGFATPAYCTAPCTTSADCSDSEWCFSSDVHLITSQVANYNHCVPRCQGICGEASLGCKAIPIVDAAGEPSWAEGCYFKEVKQIGEPCDADVECLGGFCLKDYLTTGICSLRCEQTPCPEDAACVELIPGEQWCSPKCGDGISMSGVCPLDEPEDRLDVTCAYRQQLQGGSARVCVSTSSP